MSLKRILALASSGPSDANGLAFAAWLAAQHDSVVEVIPVYADAALDIITLGMALGASLSPDAVQDLTDADRARQDHIEAAARSAAKTADLVFGPGDGAPRMSVLPRGLRPTLALSRNAALADLVVVPQDEAADPMIDDALAQALLADRAPVLVARGDPDRLSGPAAIAWDGSPQAGRAVRAALPLLAMASAVHVVQCVSGLDPSAANPDIGLLNDYLRLHGVGSGVVVQVEGEDEGASLMAAAQQRQAGLFVAGAWGRSRLHETVFGGATRSFLRDRTGPSLLLAH